MLLKDNQIEGQGENSNPMESTHFKFQNRIKQKKTDIRVLNRPTLSCTFSEAAKIYHDLPTKQGNNIQQVTLGQGPHKLSHLCKQLAILQEKWIQTHANARQKLFSKLYSIEYDTDEN